MGREDNFRKQTRRNKQMGGPSVEAKSWQELGIARGCQYPFFHQFMNGRRRKKTIAFLDSDEGEVTSHKEITNHIVNYYVWAQ